MRRRSRSRSRSADHRVAIHLINPRIFLVGLCGSSGKVAILWECQLARVICSPKFFLLSGKAVGVDLMKEFASKIWRDWLRPFALAAIIIAPVKSAIADYNWVPTGSMKPTILEGE